MAASLTQKRVDKPTPNGGDYSVAYYSNEEGEPTPKDEATRMEIVEYDKDDIAIFRTYGNITPRKGK